jgi:glutathione S-transferase
MGYISPYARKIRVVLAEKALEYEAHEVSFATASAAYDSVNPCRRVPVLVDAGQTLFESNAIIEYLLRTYPQTPSGGEPPLADVLCRGSDYWEDQQTLIGIETMLNSGLVLLQMRNNGIGPDQSEYLQREHGRIQLLLDWLDSRATRDGFVPGVFSIQDLNMVITLQWCDYRSMFEWRGRSNLEAIVERYAGRDSISATTPESAPG